MSAPARIETSPFPVYDKLRMWLTPVLYGFSMVLQVAALVFAVRMVWQRLPGRPWLTLALGMFLMLAFRAFGMFTGGSRPMLDVPRDGASCSAAVMSTGVSVSIFISLFFIKRAELTLASTERRYRALSETVPGFVWSCRPDGQVDYLNARYTEFTGLTRRHPDERRMGHVVHPDDVPRIVEHWQQAIAQKAPL